GILVADRLGSLADRFGVLDHQLLDLALGLALEIIGDAARQVHALTMDEQQGAALVAHDGDGAALCRLVDDAVRHAADRDLDAGPHLRAHRHLGQALLPPVLMTVEELFDFAAAQARRYGDAQARAAGIDAPRQPPSPSPLAEPP